MKQRIQYIDRLKGLAMLTIVFAHCEVIGELTDGPYYLTDFAQFAHLFLFMFLSGYMVSCIPNRKKIIIKLAQFLCPFIFVGYALCFLGQNKSFVDFITDLWKNGLWYLLTLAEYYILLMPLRLNKAEKIKNKFMVDIAYFLGIYFLLYACRCHLQTSIQNVIGVNHLYGFWFLFFIGFLCKRYDFTSFIEQHNWVFSAALLFVVIRLIWQPLGSIPKLPELANILVLFYLFLKRESTNTFLENQLAYIGRNSIDVYILHYFIVNNLHLKPFGNFFIQNGNYFLEGIFTFILSLIIIYISILIGYILRKSEWMNDIVFGNIAKKIINI